jgi:radical SAM superfamily enzyme YgiQ (UPF0313 family)
MVQFSDLSYDMPLWRPPSEARSLIIQATYGCSHNRCTFCHMYASKRFRVRPVREVEDELAAVAERIGPRVKRIFLADGDPLVIKVDAMVRILEACYSAFPNLERVTTYATPQNLLRKSPNALARIRRAGLTMLYYGVESGHDPTLEAVRKGATAAEIITGAQKAHAAGFVLSVTVLLGLAGRKDSLAHAQKSGAVLSRIDPRYASALTIMDPEPHHLEMLGGRIRDAEKSWGDMNVWELLAELGEMIAAMDVTDCIFRSNHASNYLPLKGTLPVDKTRLLEMIKRVLAARSPDTVRPEWARGL